MMTPEEMKAAARLTLRQFYETYYDKSELAKSTKQKYEYELRCWERKTLNPPIEEITSETAADFRQAMIEDEYSGETINLYWTDLRCILRIASPENHYNPRGLGVILRCPYMKPAIEEHGRPNRINLKDLGEFYRACQHATSPRLAGVEAPDLWRALIVLAYFTGLRKGDLLSLSHNQFDLQESRFWFRASKTRKADEFPLHPLAVQHLERIWYPQRERIFKGFEQRGGRFYDKWNAIGRRAGVADGLTLHDIRRTACSEIERVKRGMAEVLLQHYRKDVTGLYYLNQMEELTEAIRIIRFPEAFMDEPGNSDVKPSIAVRKPALPPPIEESEWAFRPGSFCFRGEWHPIVGRFPKVLEMLVRAGGPLTWQQINDGIGWGLPVETAPGRIRQSIYELRKVLRVSLGLSESFDPIPCVHRGEGGAYTLVLPRMTVAASASVGSEADGE